MNTINQMKNMIVLKNLPSNLIEEAFVILKPNKKVKILNTTENKTENCNLEEKQGEYIIKEAEMVISSYLSNAKEETKIKSNTIKQIENKYKRLKKITAFLSILLAINLFLGLIVK